ncbi:peroxisomal assembly protein [Ascosphaera pollenicola]|nr:peroxisomal assembly protein [Ascosphaera pollenicola]
MGSFRTYLAVYIFGGITFVPLLLVLAVAFAYYTLPEAEPEQGIKRQRSLSSPQPAPDDEPISKTEPDELNEKFSRTHESDVAAGYFAVLREYNPGGVNGKPPERANTSANETLAAESPSVYQSVYRSLFDRKPTPSIEPAKDQKKQTRKSNNVFYVVIRFTNSCPQDPSLSVLIEVSRHGHLLLYDDSEQIEVRHVVSLAHHNVSISAGGESIPEGELWTKRTAICLSRTSESAQEIPDSRSTLPFYFFSENASEKEDFYFAITANIDRAAGSSSNPPIPQRYDPKHIVTLVKKLHSSEEQLQTRWLNALIGRWFLGIYRTEESKLHIRKKIEKKLARVKKPNFITKLALDFIDLGDAAPLITNPRLKDLTVDGECCVQFDMSYTGNFKTGLAATARIDLGPRIKAREVDMLLSVTLKKMSGPCLLMIKPPPSNRMWFSFETIPKIDMAIEPIVSSRQITYGLVLRAIENRIREVIAETLVFPFWDDIPFLDTEGKSFRGGIWEKSPGSQSPDIGKNEPLHHAATAPDPGESNGTTLNDFLSSLQKSNDDSHTSDANSIPEESKKRNPRSGTSSISSGGKKDDSSPAITDDEEINKIPRRPKSTSLSKSSPSLVSTDNTPASNTAESKSHSQVETSESRLPVTHNTPADFKRKTSGEQLFPKDGRKSNEGAESRPRSYPSDSSERRLSTSSTVTAAPNERRRSINASSAESSASAKSQNQRHVMESLNSAAAAAKKWSLNVLNRNNDDNGDGEMSRQHTLSRHTSTHSLASSSRAPPAPRSLPPREMPPLPPRPQSNAKTTAAIKRKPVPPPFVPAASAPPTVPESTPSHDHGPN